MINHLGMDPQVTAINDDLTRAVLQALRNWRHPRRPMLLAELHPQVQPFLRDVSSWPPPPAKAKLWVRSIPGVRIYFSETFGDYHVELVPAGAEAFAEPPADLVFPPPPQAALLMRAVSAMDPTKPYRVAIHLRGLDGGELPDGAANIVAASSARLRWAVQLGQTTRMSDEDWDRNVAPPRCIGNSCVQFRVSESLAAEVSRRAVGRARSWYGKFEFTVAVRDDRQAEDVPGSSGDDASVSEDDADADDSQRRPSAPSPVVAAEAVPSTSDSAAVAVPSTDEAGEVPSTAAAAASAAAACVVPPSAASTPQPTTSLLAGATAAPAGGAASSEPPDSSTSLPPQRRGGGLVPDGLEEPDLPPAVRPHQFAAEIVTLWDVENVPIPQGVGSLMEVRAALDVQLQRMGYLARVGGHTKHQLVLATANVGLFASLTRLNLGVRPEDIKLVLSRPKLEAADHDLRSEMLEALQRRRDIQARRVMEVAAALALSSPWPVQEFDPEGGQAGGKGGASAGGVGGPRGVPNPQEALLEAHLSGRLVVCIITKDADFLAHVSSRGEGGGAIKRPLRVAEPGSYHAPAPVQVNDAIRFGQKAIVCVPVPLDPEAPRLQLEQAVAARRFYENAPGGGSVHMMEWRGLMQALAHILGGAPTARPRRHLASS